MARYVIKNFYTVISTRESCFVVLMFNCILITMLFDRYLESFINGLAIFGTSATPIGSFVKKEKIL